MINCEHVIIERVVLLFFPVNCNKLYQTSLTKIVEITCVFFFSQFSRYSRSSRKRPPREFEKVVVTRAGRLQE